ncbi:MAG: phenylalanine--tRNA ligase subunit beta [Planctomycetota bacterium]
MIVSWDWLKEYVSLSMDHDHLVDRLTMSGLNHEGTEPIGEDQAIDLEVTSNRADCLGHLGVAREIAALYDLDLKIPDPQPTTIAESVTDHCSVEIESPETCFRYTARLIRGVKIGPSPQWMQKRLKSLGIGIVNNVVDATNYVMFECGQPLHAFDFAKLSEGKIVVRSASQGEQFEAIDHHKYLLEPGMCVISDGKVPVAIGGVMGGADSEVSEETVDVLIEAAYFDQLSVRQTARKLKLHSPSSFRFERDIDSANLDWASRRCCEFILEMAGGELLEGVVDVGQAPEPPPILTLRFHQLSRILGIEIPTEQVGPILKKLGLSVKAEDQNQITVAAPTWRKDLTREVDLIEEVGRIYGFDKIPDDVNVPMTASYRLPSNRVIDKIRAVMTSAGYDESMTPSLVPEKWSNAFSPWSDKEPLTSSQPMLGVLEEYSKNIGAVNLLRRSLVPSMIETRRINEYRANLDANLFETARVYLTKGENEIPVQPLKLAFISGQDFYQVKGVLETIVQNVAPEVELTIHPCKFDILDPSLSAEIRVGDQVLGWIGTISKSGKKLFGLKNDATVVEIDFGILESKAVLIPKHKNLSTFPAVSRDFNFIVENKVHWQDLQSTVQKAAGDLLESVRYLETFRDEKKDGAGKKRLLLSVVLRSSEETLTGQQADEVSKAIIDQCKASHSAALVG